MNGMIKNDLLLRTVAGEQVERPPVWLMRQAGRTLPGYRKIRAQVADFKTFVKSPNLVAAATVEPVELLGVDAAILFSDILVIPEAMGLDYELIEKKGPWFPKTIQSYEDVAALKTGHDAAKALDYVYQGIEATKNLLDNSVPLLGFSGAPWTIFAYMVEGSGSKTFSKAKQMLYQQPDLAHALLKKITDATIAYLQQKIEHGVHLVQLFDSWGGVLSPTLYEQFSLPYLQKICQAIQSVPITIFAKGAWFALADIAQLDCQVIGLDWTITPQQARSWIGEHKIMQGNLDPCQLYGTPAQVADATHQMLQQFGGRHIANLGHGVYPDTPLSSIQAFVSTVKAFRYE